MPGPMPCRCWARRSADTQTQGRTATIDHVEARDDTPAFERVYAALRALAERRLANNGGASLQATGLVHEVWLKLSREMDGGPLDASHYFATAAQAMRWILVDRARRRRSARLASESRSDEAAEAAAEEEARDEELLDLDEALEQLERSHPRKAQVVLHRYFAGLSVEDTAAALGVSPATVKREWQFARAWLARAIAEAG